MRDPDDTTLTKPAANLIVEGQGRLSASLIVLSGPSIGKIFRLDKPRQLIGRSSGADIWLDDESVSRHHAEVLKSAEAVTLVDLGSKNGTLVNGERLEGARELKNGDKLQFGSSTLLRFNVQDMLDEAAAQLLYDSTVRDGLTGAFNRKFLMEALSKELAYANRHDIPLGLLMMDVDHFKQINDTYGHTVGDQVLVKLVEAVHDAIRTEDVFGRYGGEEFALVLRDISEDVSVAVAERLRRRIEETPVMMGGVPVRVTISIGVATYVPGAFHSVEEFVDAADKYLLLAKSQGRNRVMSRWLCGS